MDLNAAVRMGGSELKVSRYAYIPAPISRITTIIEVRIRSIDDSQCIHELRDQGLIVRCHLQHLSHNGCGWIDFHSSRNNDSVCSSSTASNGEEQIAVLTGIRSDDEPVSKNHFRF